MDADQEFRRLVLNARERRIEEIVRKSERDRIITWLRNKASGDTASLLNTLARKLEAGDHWEEP